MSRVATTLAVLALVAVAAMADTTFTKTKIENYASNPFSTESADLNGDGRADIVVASLGGDAFLVYLSNDDSGTSYTKTSFSQSGKTYRASSVKLGDVDGDSFIDVVLSTGYNGGFDLTWFKNDGTGAFTYTSSQVIHYGNNAFNGYDVRHTNGLALTDLNLDGNLDIIATNYHGIYSDLRVFFGDGTGDFTPEDTIASFFLLTNPRGMVVFDYNGDSYPDLAVCYSSSNTVVVYIGDDSTDRFDQSSSVVLLTGLFTNPTGIDAGDFDGDGRVDLVVTLEQANKIVWYRNEADGDFSSPNLISQADGPWDVKAVDLDRDLKLDITVAVFDDDDVLAFFCESISGSDVVFGPKQVLHSGCQGCAAVQTAYLNNDDCLDVFTASYDDNDVDVFIQDDCPFLEYVDAFPGKPGREFFNLKRLDGQFQLFNIDYTGVNTTHHEFCKAECTNDDLCVGVTAFVNEMGVMRCIGVSDTGLPDFHTTGLESTSYLKLVVRPTDVPGDALAGYTLEFNSSVDGRRFSTVKGQSDRLTTTKGDGLDIDACATLCTAEPLCLGFTFWINSSDEPTCVTLADLGLPNYHTKTGLDGASYSKNA